MDDYYGPDDYASASEMDFDGADEEKARIDQEIVNEIQSEPIEKKGYFYGACCSCGRNGWINDDELCTRCAGEDAEWVRSMKNPFGDAHPRDILDAVRQAHPDHLTN